MANADDLIKLTIEFRRGDDPPLFDELAAIPKGRRRIARLRTLAHDGLIAHAALSSGAFKKESLADSCEHGDECGLNIDQGEQTALPTQLTEAMLDSLDAFKES
ncbi:MAG: hypothetical protein EKK45_01065 [Curvibacter sp.]|nr:MAG: hypothetical protein EKK45_01065 [Curvibacter sp.]